MANPLYLRDAFTEYTYNMKTHPNNFTIKWYPFSLFLENMNSLTQKQRKSRFTSSEVTDPLLGLN